MPSFDLAGPCPICLTDDVRMASHESADAFYFQCSNCGEHTLSRSAVAALKNYRFGEEKDARRAFGLRNIGRDTVLTYEAIADITNKANLPEAAECIDELLSRLVQIARPGISLNKRPSDLRAACGALNGAAAVWALQEAEAAEFIRRIDANPFADPDRTYTFIVTGKGWAHHRQRMREGAGSRHAFMAMDFNHTWLWDFFRDHLQPAVQRTGFELRTTDHPGKIAGLIDNRMRVEVRTARFVICDLTHSNRGAYWEAGFAEGIGRPVFYICRKTERDSKDKATAPHFDTAHQHIIAWDQADPGPAMRELVDMIRATLPGEAKMEDTGA